MLFLSNDKTKFIISDSEGAPCFIRGTHTKLAKEQGVDLTKMENLTFAYFKNGKGMSFKDFLNK